MLLHIGRDLALRLQDVVIILDRPSSETALSTREFLDISKTEGRFSGVVDEDTKSYVVTKENVYPSPISSTTLSKRAYRFRVEDYL